jgi:YVTN family beta-propeller protein
MRPARKEFLMQPYVLRASTAVLLAALVGCSSTDPSGSFLDGTASDPQIGLVVNSTGRALTMFQLGNPAEQRQVPLGTSNTLTPIGLSRRGLNAVIPLGEAASVALIDLPGERIVRFFTVASGNLSGSVFLDDRTVLVANLVDDYVGKFTIDQASGAITETVAVAPLPSAVLTDGSLAYVISGNLDDSFMPLGNGIVTVIDPSTMTVVGTITTGGTNPQAAAFGPDGLLYVVNTGDFVGDGSVTVIDPVTRQEVTTVGGFGVAPGSISIDDNGLAYVSGFATGTVVWNTATREFVRDPSNAVCARLDILDPGSACRGAFAATTDRNGTVYQVFFGDEPQGLPPAVFVFDPVTFDLRDSLDVGVGPSSLDIAVFGN